MPRSADSSTPRIPKYRHYRPKNLAVVRIAGRDHYLGPYGSPGSREKYARLVAEHFARPTSTLPTAGSSSQDGSLLVGELILAFWERHVVVHYVKNGKPTSEQDNIRQALGPLRRLYASTPVADFGPSKLKAVRQAMIESGRCRNLINKDVNRIRSMFRWAVEHELVPIGVYQALQAVSALAKGRTAAKESAPILPVRETVVRATLPHLSSTLAAMVELQMVTGARPGEVVCLRPCDVERGRDGLWLYRPSVHKMQHHDRQRVIVLGPRAIEILKPWLDRQPDAFCFSPAEVVAARAEVTRKEGTKKLGASRARRPKPEGSYTKDSYRVAIARACYRAFPHPTLSLVDPKRLTSEQKAELKAWRKTHRWHPLQLRHLAATKIRAKYGLEAAQVVLGHSHADVTQVYAERDLAKATEVMRAIG